MSVLIKDVRMPKSCEKCIFSSWSNFFQIYVCNAIHKTEPVLLFDGKQTKSTAVVRSARADNCPLVPVPPHGRLIDADALLTNYEEMILSREYGKCVRVNGIMRAPTIIEADSNLQKQHEEIRDCSTCKHRLYNDYHDRYYCYDPDPMNIGCIEWSHWQSKEGE